MELQTEVVGIKLEHPLMNAAGTCKMLEDVQELARTPVAAIMVGSITLEERMGNSGDVYWAGPTYSLNSLGLPNKGAEYYKVTLPVMRHIAHEAGKPLFVSVAGFSPEEYGILAELAFDGGADLVELNLGCPNVWSGNTQKRIACFDPEMVAEIHQLVAGSVGVDAKISNKISPFSDPFALAEVAKVIGASMLVKAVTTMNTFPNAFGFNGSKPRITPGEGLAGLAGHAIRPIGLGQVRQLRQLLPESMEIIGVGGIGSGQDIVSYRDSGAVAVQVATAYIEEGGWVFSRLLQELSDLVPA